MSTTRTPSVSASLGVFVAVRVLSLLALAAALVAWGNRTLLGTLTNWDGQWYARIAEHGYGHVTHHPDGRLLADYAFFPLLPGLERAVASVTGLPYARAGLVVAIICSLIAVVGIHRVATRVAGPDAGLPAVVLWTALPVADVAWMAYTESLLTALAAWCLWCCLDRRYVTAGLLAAVAGLTRPTAATLVVAVVVAAWPALRHGPRARAVVGCLLAPLGTLGFLAWVGIRHHDARAYFHLTEGWGNGLDGGQAFVTWIADLTTTPPYVLGPLVVVGVALLVGLVWGSHRLGHPAPVVAFSAAMVVLALATSGYFGSKPRYLFPAFTLLLPVAQWLTARSASTRWGVLVVLTVGSAAYGAIWLSGSGPP